jgi:hypothetical protein
MIQTNFGSDYTFVQAFTVKNSWRDLLKPDIDLPLKSKPRERKQYLPRLNKEQGKTLSRASSHNKFTHAKKYKESYQPMLIFLSLK